jgi:hypothetical protein
LPKNSSKPCIGRQVLVTVAEVVLAELPGRVALFLERRRDRRISRPQTEVATGHPDLGQSCPDRVLSADERRATRGAALLAVVVGEPAPSSAIRSMLGVR